MEGAASEGSEARFAAYVEALGQVLGHADRQEPMRDYCLGLMMPLARKSVEPLAAVTAPATVAAKHQSLLHFVGNAPWSDSAMLAKVGELVLPAIERSGAIEAWIIDDTGFPKKGQHSVGVTRQYCGQLGKQDNCQVAVTLSLANHDASLPIAYRLYLPEDWAQDQARRDKAKVPETIAFQTKPEIALEQIKAARAAGLPEGVVLMAGTGWRSTPAATESPLSLSLRAGIGPDACAVLAAGAAFAAAGVGGVAAAAGEFCARRRRSQLSVSAPLEPAADLAGHTWREGGADWLASRFRRRRGSYRRIAIAGELTGRPARGRWLLMSGTTSSRWRIWLPPGPRMYAFFDQLVDIAELR